MKNHFRLIENLLQNTGGLGFLSQLIDKPTVANLLQIKWLIEGGY
jgi:hypothetical protein